MTQRQIPSGVDYAVVAGIDLNGLGVVRALAGAGVRVIALDTDLAKPTAVTRYGTKIRVRALSGEVFIEDLLELRQKLDRSPVLILTQEASVGTVSALRARIMPAYRFTMPADSVMQSLLDKICFQMIAERHGFPIPRAIRLSNNETSAAFRQLRYPCVLKPATKDPEYGARFAKAYKVASAEEALAIWEQMRQSVARATLQEWIEGDDSDVYFCLQYRTVQGSVASFVGRKLCQWPRLVGGTASCMPAPEFAAELHSLTDQFFAASGFVGLGSMEYKRDRRDQRFYMVEPTVGRTDLQEEVAALNGVNIPLAVYQSELELSFASGRPVHPPRMWRDSGGSALARKAGAIMPEIATRLRISDALFRLSDPAPFLKLKLLGARNRLARFGSLIPQRGVAALKRVK